MSVSVIGILDSSLDFSGATVVLTVADLTLVLADTSRIVWPTEFFVWKTFSGFLLPFF